MPPVTRTPTPYSYSSAVAAGEFVFLGLHRGFGTDFTEQLEGAFDALAKTLDEYDVTLHDLVKVHVWLKHIEDLPAMEQHVTGYFPPDGFPARMTSTTEFIDPGCLLMIEGVAYRS